MIAWDLYIMAIIYLIAGALHFGKPNIYRPLMPTWIPKHNLMIFLSGLAELILAFLLLPLNTRALAAWGVIALLIYWAYLYT